METVINFEYFSKKFNFLKVYPKTFEIIIISMISNNNNNQ